mmetsp:Transcript_31000/g.65605  ORF Transcript_31000/g.65605 Transcript_31000/m.65605 type:complete len:84 (-) Transcript_31000:348-599(-)
MNKNKEYTGQHMPRHIPNDFEKRSSNMLKGKRWGRRSQAWYDGGSYSNKVGLVDVKYTSSYWNIYYADEPCVCKRWVLMELLC